MSDDYYSTCPFPKTMGEPKKAKQKQNGYKNKPFRKCYYTGVAGAERHEIFPGTNRQISINEGFQIDVCPAIHYALQYGTTEWAKKERSRWQAHFQKKKEQEYINEGCTEEQARMKWLLLIGKNYITEKQE